MNLPAEAMEMEAPIRVHRSRLRKDSGHGGNKAALIDGIRAVIEAGKTIP